MERYLIDNNVISRFFSNEYTQDSIQFLSQIIDQGPNISVITQIEALTWRSNPESEAIIRNFITDSNIVQLNETIVARCVQLRRQRKIRTPDAIIAATAIEGNFILLTHDSDFNVIPGLITRIP